MSRVLAIGECLVEVAPAGAEAYRLGFAGDTFNTCWYLKRLGKDRLTVDYLTAVGRDEISGKMLSFMREAGINPLAQIDEQRSVGLYLISLDRGERSFAYWRSDSAARHMMDERDVLPDIRAGDLVYVSGITLAVLTPRGRVHLHSALDAARRAGAIVAFDPNLRPALWPDAETMRQTITQAAAQVDIILPSYCDEHTHFGDTSPAHTARRYGAQGALVVVKNGPDEIVIYEAGATRELGAPPVAEVVDTTAAGDSFNAGFLEGYLAGNDLEAACAQGCAVASKVIGGRGALVEF